MLIKQTLQSIRDRIEKARCNSPLARDRVALLAACKGQPTELIEQAIECGVIDFGENRVQEAGSKWPTLRERHSRIRLHLIGPLQSNKALQAVELFDVIQSIDRIKLADELAEAMDKTKKFIPCLIQVNTGKEPQKAGVMPEDADALIEHCIDQLDLPVTGLMCIPPLGQPPAPHFGLLYEIARRHELADLSMGMSDDFETAVRMGSSCIRIGRALFGERLGD